MTDIDSDEEATLFPKSAGERLKEAREAQGLPLAEIAARTRIPIRQLEAIETSNFAALPSSTYSVGFAKAYARAVGLDEVAIGRDVRGQDGHAVRPTEYETYDIAETSRLPGGGLVLAALVGAVLLLIGVGLWYGTNLFRGEEARPVVVDSLQTAQAPAAPPPVAVPATGGQVSLTATDTVWLRVYDAAGKTLYESTMKPGDRYDVPDDADHPMVNVGRPDQLEVRLNGSIVPPLGDGSHAIRDVGVSAAALRARGNGETADTPAATSPAGTVTTPAAAPSTAGAPAPAATPLP